MAHQWTHKISKLCFIAIASSLLPGCILLMLNGPSKLDAPHTTTSTQHHFKARVYAMRGFLDVFSTGMNTLASKVRQALPVEATALSYLEEKKLAQFLIHDYQSKHIKSPIVLIGHSYGADDQIIVAQQLNQAHVPVALLITLDNTKQQTIPPNVRVFYNINSGRSVLSWLVPWGTPLIAEGKHTRMFEVNLVKDKHFNHVNHFNIDKLPEVQAYIIDIIKKHIEKT